MKAGYVPIDEIGPTIRELVEERWPHGRGYEILSEKIGCDQSAVYSIANEPDKAGADFDLVDRILCALGRQDLWRGRFEGIYLSVDFRETCAVPACAKRFREIQVADKVKRTCSKRCSDLHMQVKRGRCTGERLRQKNRCLKGHKLEGENVYVRANGKRCCVTCRRIAQREWQKKYRKKPSRAA